MKLWTQEARMNYARIFAPLILPWLLFLGNTAAAQDLLIGTKLVCDTQEQVTLFVAHYSDNAQTAVDAVNSQEHDPTACAIATIAYIAEPSVSFATARNQNGAFRIVEIVVVGLVMSEGIQTVHPTRLYSLIPVEERSA
jgi:hypothetical protein